MSARLPAMAGPEAIPRSWATVLRWAAVVTLLCAAAIHTSVVAEHFREWVLEGLFFIALALVEALMALAVAATARTAVYGGAIALSLATIALWTVSRTAGVPVGPEPLVPEPVGRADVAATLLELATATVLAPLVLPAPGRAVTALAVAVVSVAAAALTAFALAPGANDAHDHGFDFAVDVPAPGPTGEFSPADARRAKACARRAGAGRGSTPPRTRITITARHLCFDATTLTLAANRQIVVRLMNRERSPGPSRAHTFSIYAFSTIPAKRHPVVIGDPVAPGGSIDVAFRAPPPGSYFFQCDIHRFMRGVVVFR